MSDRRERSAVGHVGVVTLGVVALGLLGGLLWASLRVAELDQQIENASSERVRLADRERLLRQERNEALQAEKNVIRMFGLCRDSKDIPHLDGRQVVAVQRGESDLFLYNPAGIHALEIKATWAVKDSQDKTSPGKDGSKVWEVALLSNAGYHFHIVGFSFDESPVSWKLKCNKEGGELNSGEIPIIGFRMGSGSWWGGNDHLFFPHELTSKQSLATPGKPGESVSKQVFRSKRFGTKKNSNFEVAFEVRFKMASPGVTNSPEVPFIPLHDPKTLPITRLRSLNFRVTDSA